jgi:acetyl-CoA carboxylase carboxyltransferase component
VWVLSAKAPIEKRKALEEEWATTMSTPLMAAYAGQVDDIITADELRMKIASALEMLSMKTDFLQL